MQTDKTRNVSTDYNELRRRAEELLRAKKAGSSSLQGEEEAQRLVHELAVHQIELEMQNEELRQARDDLEKILEKYTDLYDYAPVGYCTLDHDGIIREINFAGAVLLGNDRSRLIGRSFAQNVSGECRQAFSAFIGTALDIEQKSSLEVLINRDAQSGWVQIEALSCDSGQQCRFGMIDITARKRAEGQLAEKSAALENLNCALEERIAQTVNELRQKDQILMLQDRQALMGEMIDNIAHQWRQPLNTLGLVVQQLPLAYDIGEFSREYLEENTTMAMKVIQQMSQTIDDFRNFFRSDKEPTSFLLNQVIARTLSFIERPFKDNKINIAVKSEGEPVATGFPNELAQVLMNIMMNARDALIEHEVDDPLISIHVFVEGGRSVVTISDNAGGIPEEIIDKVFDPNFTTKGQEHGTGIGLYMSKTIIEKNMGGQLTVRNTGNGAVFRIKV